MKKSKHIRNLSYSPIRAHKDQITIDFANNTIYMFFSNEILVDGITKYILRSIISQKLAIHFNIKMSFIFSGMEVLFRQVVISITFVVLVSILFSLHQSDTMREHQYSFSLPSNSGTILAWPLRVKPSAYIWQ